MQMATYSVSDTESVLQTINISSPYTVWDKSIVYFTHSN